MCVDFTKLHKPCPKHNLALPRIDELVDATVGHKLLTFIDAYSEHNQIKMHLANQEHISFITE